MPSARAALDAAIEADRVAGSRSTWPSGIVRVLLSRPGSPPTSGWRRPGRPSRRPRARLTALEARLAEEEARGIARAARRLGGRRLDEDLVIAPEFRAAAEAALADVDARLRRRCRRRRLPWRRSAGRSWSRSVPRPAAGSEDARERRFRERLAAAGGGTLDAAVRRDSLGAARRLLARCAWLPDLAALPRHPARPAARLGSGPARRRRGGHRRRGQPRLRRVGPGAPCRGGPPRPPRSPSSRPVTGGSARPRPARPPRRPALRRRSRLPGEPRRARPATRRSAEEAERLAARQLEAVVREAAWHEAQAERLAAELERARVMARALDDGAVAAAGRRRRLRAARSWPGRPAIAAWEARAAELRARRDRLAEQARGPRSRPTRGGAPPGARRGGRARWPRNDWRGPIGIWRPSASASEARRGARRVARRDRRDGRARADRHERRSPRRGPPTRRIASG